MPHHSLILIPFICLGLAWLHREIRGKNTIVVLFLLILSFSLASFRYCHMLSLPDTRAISRVWIEKNIPQDKSLSIEGALGNDIVLGPRVNENSISALNSYFWVKENGGTGLFYWTLHRNSSGGYFVYKQGQDADYYISNGLHDKDMTGYELIKTFSPASKFHFYYPLLFHGYGNPGPEIKVWKRL